MSSRVVTGSNGPCESFAMNHKPPVTPTPSGHVRVIDYRQRDQLGVDEALVYIGRANGRYGLKASPLANPFTLKAHGEQALMRYAEWLPTDAAAQVELDQLAARLGAGENLALACWCNPKPCHGDIVAEALRHRCDSGYGADATRR